MKTSSSVSISRNAPTKSRLIWVVITITPAVIALLYINHYGVNVPVADQWEFLAMFQKAYTGELSITDIFSFHHEHRVVVPRVFMLIFAVATNYNNLIEMYFGWLLLVLCGAVVFKSYSRRNSLEGLTPLRFVPVIWLLFSWRQYENFLWGWQITFFMTAFAAVLAFYLLESSSAFDKYFVGAVCSGFVASFSSLNGLLVWPIGLLQIWTSRQRLNTYSHNSYLSESIWTLTATCIYVFYFIGFTTPSHHPSVLFFVTAPLTSFIYLLCLLGSPIAWSMGSAVVAGLLLTAIAITIYFVEFKHSARLIVSFWDAVILFAFSSCLMLAIGRSGFGVPQAFQSRYTTFTILGIVALYLKSLESFSKRRGRNTAVRVILLALIAQGVATSFINGMEEGERFRASRIKEIYIIRHLATQDENRVSNLWFVDPTKIRHLTPFLAEYKLSFFNQSGDAR